MVPPQSLQQTENKFRKLLLKLNAFEKLRGSEYKDSAIILDVLLLLSTQYLNANSNEQMHTRTLFCKKFALPANGYHPIVPVS